MMSALLFRLPTPALPTLHRLSPYLFPFFIIHLSIWLSLSFFNSFSIYFATFIFIFLYLNLGTTKAVVVRLVRQSDHNCLFHPSPQSIIRIFNQPLTNRGPETSVACALLKCFMNFTPPSTRINWNKQIWHKVQPMNNLLWVVGRNVSVDMNVLPPSSQVYTASQPVLFFWRKYVPERIVTQNLVSRFQGEKVPERRSGLRPSNLRNGVPERSVTKMPLVTTPSTFSRQIPG
jgi:hypothetical protein